jgi:predicted site-specific integrase-resolvase
MQRRNEYNHRLDPSHPDRAVIYCRVAAAESRSRLGTYLEVCRQYAQQRKLSVVAEFADVGSGLNLNRDGLNQMRQLVSGEEVRAIILPTLSCLARSADHLRSLYQEFESKGARLLIPGQEEVLR